MDDNFIIAEEKSCVSRDLCWSLFFQMLFLNLLIFVCEFVVVCDLGHLFTV